MLIIKWQTMIGMLIGQVSIQFKTETRFFNPPKKQSQLVNIKNARWILLFSVVFFFTGMVSLCLSSSFLNLFYYYLSIAISMHGLLHCTSVWMILFEQTQLNFNFHTQYLPLPVPSVGLTQVGPLRSNNWGADISRKRFPWYHRWQHEAHPLVLI